MLRGCRIALLLVIAGLLAPSARAQQVVINEVLARRGGSDSHANQIVELRNAGTLSVNVGGWVFCHELNYTSQLPAGQTLGPGGILTIHFKATGINSSTDVYFPDDELSDITDLGLYVSPPFTTPANMRAFVQFGGVPGNGRQSVAAQANLWTLNAFIQSWPVDESIELCADDPSIVTSYVPQSSPTIGQANGCGVPTQEVSWGTVKSIFIR